MDDAAMCEQQRLRAAFDHHFSKSNCVGRDPLFSLWLSGLLR
jgi:hypothetical protein